MKRTSSSINQKRDISSSQRKHIRSSTPVQQEENMEDLMGDKSLTTSNQKTVKKAKYHNSKEKNYNDENNPVDHPTTITSTQCASSISFSLPTNSEKTTSRKANPLSQSQDINLHGTQSAVILPVVSGRK